MKNKKEIIILWIFLIFFILFLSIRFKATQGWDESRHACQAHFFYDYFKNILSGNFMSLSNFLESYQKVGYNIGWYALFDPPFLAIVQGFLFLFFSPSTITSGFATLLFIIIGSFLLYHFSLKILKKSYLAMSVVFLYLLSPIIIDMGNLQMLAIPISFMMIAWYYFTFHRKGKKIVFSNKNLSFRTNILIGALFLTAATLMKYHSIIYVLIFFFFYISYLWIKNKKFPKTIFTIAIIQSFIVLFLSIWWIKFSLFDNNMLQRVLFEGVGRGKQSFLSFNYAFAYFINTFKETRFIALFALIPFIKFFKKKSFISKNKRLIIFILSVYITATLLLSSRHFRYMIHIMPFVFILIVEGVNEVSNFIAEKLKKEEKLIRQLSKQIFAVLIILLCIFSAYSSYNLMKKQLDSWGEYSSDFVDYLSKLPRERYVINIDADMANGAGYYYNPDLFIFETMMANDRLNIHNPKEMRQFVSYYRWQQIAGNYKKFVEELNKLSEKIKLVVVIFKFSDPRYDLKGFKQELLEKNFTKKELKWYELYEK